LEDGDMDEKKTCCVCQQPFVPHPKVKRRQKTCATKACRNALKRQRAKTWREQNPDYFKGRYETAIKQWYEKNANYKKRYRLEHPEYVRRNVLYLKTHRQRKGAHQQKSKRSDA
jgi:hypothetical protein